MSISAWLRRHVVEPPWSVYAATPRLREWHLLERTQHLPLATLQERQADRLRHLVTVAAAGSSFYARRFADAGVAPSAIQTPADLRRLPLLTKRDIRASTPDMLVRGVANESLLQFKTGGSTGTPLKIYITDDVSERRNACARRCNRWTGWEVGEPVAAVWGNPELPRTTKERLRHHLLDPVIYLDTMAVTAASVRAFADEWRRVRPTLLFGHAHSIYLLARIVEDENIRDVRPKAILSTSMMLLGRERDVIERVFGIRAFDRYGCEEVGLIGCECERHAGMHVNIDHLVVEFVREDGEPALAGEDGFVVVTDLLNEAMPFIRYRVEDMSSPIAAPCPCGRGLPLMGRVSGRVADFLVRTDGVRVAGVSLIENTLTKFGGIEQMQIVQDERDRVLLRLVAGDGFERDARTQLLDYFGATFPGARIELELVDEIAREPNGKFRFAICRVDG